MEEEENDLGANSEIRYISLELMKLAQKSGKAFDEVAQEYLENTCRLQKMIAAGGTSRPQKKKMREHARQK